MEVSKLPDLHPKMAIFTYLDTTKYQNLTTVIVTSHTSHRAKTVMKNLQYQKIYLTPTKQKCLENFWNRSIHPVKYA